MGGKKGLYIHPPRSSSWAVGGLFMIPISGSYLGGLIVYIYERSRKENVGTEIFVSCLILDAAAAVGTITRNRKDSKEVGEIERVKGRLICSNCGTENERGERPCSVCGETLSAGKGEDQET